MKKCVCLISMGLGLTVLAGIPQAITYHGVLMRQGGYAEKRTLLSLTFSLYEGATNTVPVWARTIPVSIAQDGSFYTELRDDAGSVPKGMDGTKTLVDALAAMRETPEVGLTPPGAGEIAPRQKLEMGVRAARAVRARVADEVVCKNGIQLEGARVAELNASQLTAGAFAVVGNGKCTFSGAGERDVGGGNAVVTVAGVKPAAPATEVRESFQGAYTTDNAPCDMTLTYASEKNGAFSVIVPKGGKVVKKADGSAAHVVSGTLFAK